MAFVTRLTYDDLDSIAREYPDDRHENVPSTPASACRSTGLSIRTRRRSQFSYSPEIVTSRSRQEMMAQSRPASYRGSRSH